MTQIKRVTANEIWTEPTKATEIEALNTQEPDHWIRDVEGRLGGQLSKIEKHPRQQTHAPGPWSEGLMDLPSEAPAHRPVIWMPDDPLTHHDLSRKARGGRGETPADFLARKAARKRR